MAFNEELLFIKVFDKDKFLQNDTPEYSVFLPVNPYNVVFSNPRSTSFQQTLQPRRFVILDWGSDILTMTVRAQTGNLLSDKVQFFKGEQSPKTVFKRNNVEIEIKTYEQLIAISEDYPVFVGAESHSIDKIIQEGVLQALSPNPPVAVLSSARFIALKLLEYIYYHFDANKQLMVLEWMNKKYYGIITDFSYNYDVASMWNIKYEFTYKYLPEISFLEDLKYNVDLIQTPL